MDPVAEIKARLPIEELVGQYCQLQKKGRQFVCVCPFHQDTRPSMQVSPDKGIAYCFACNSGGDVFSFYEKIEGVDFKQALKELAERAGVTLENTPVVSGPKKDEKERLQLVLQHALAFYQSQFQSSQKAKEYVQKRSVPAEQIEEFALGFAPDSFSDTYQHLLKQGFSRKEITTVGLGIQKDLNDERIYDRFRNRLMFPVYDHQGKLVAFGGRTLGDDDAKYINSSENPLYNKSAVLYGFSHAKEAIRNEESVILVEGYFDVLATRRAGLYNVVAASGTAFTQQHVKLIKRSCDKIVLCLDQDRAGQEAAERAFLLCAEEEMAVHIAVLSEKDPDEALAASPEAFKEALTTHAIPYIDYRIQRLTTEDVQSADGKRKALKQLMPLLDVVTSSVEKEDYLTKVAGLVQTTITALGEDLERLKKKPVPQLVQNQTASPVQKAKREFSAVEITLALLFQFPALRQSIQQLIEPEEPFCKALFHALKKAPDTENLTIEMLHLSPEYAERAAILQLYAEHHEFSLWSDSLAQREFAKNCTNANRIVLRQKQQEISSKLLKARQEGDSGEEQRLSVEFQKILQLGKMANV